MSDRVFRRRLTLLLAALLGAAALALTLAPRATQAILPVTPDGQPVASLAPMLEKVVPAVVNINSKTRVRVRNPFVDDPLFRQFFGMQNAPRERIEQSLGSGVIIDAAKGYVLTNNHVIEGADDIEVELGDGRNARAKTIGTDPETDIAVLRIDLDKLPTVAFGDVEHLQVGDVVLAIGNPFGVGQTVTSGIVSALGRNTLGINTFENFIQTDAAINPGNSGGALVDVAGNLLGINTAIFSKTGGSLGIGFAIPVSTARQVMESLIRDGRVTRGWIGVEPRDLTPEMAKTLDLPVKQGVLIAGLVENGPASEGGIRLGDVVVKVAEAQVNNTPQLLNAVAALKPRQTATLTVQRGNKRLDVPVTVGQRPPTRPVMVDR